MACTGTHDFFSEAKFLEKRQGLKIACLKGIAYRQGCLTKDKMINLAKTMLKNQYGQYLIKIIEDLDYNSERN